MKYLDYLFLRIFRWYEKKEKDMPIFMSCSFLTVVFSFTVINILILLEIITDEQFIFANKAGVFVVVFVVYTFVIFRYNKKRLGLIKQRHINEVVGLKKKRGFIVAGYILFVFLFPLVRAYIQHHT